MKRGILSMTLAGLLLATAPTITYPQQNITLEQKIEKKFPNKQIKDIEDFRQYADDIMYIVAEKMHLKIDENIPKPRIVTNDDITTQEFSKLLGYPEDFFTAVCPYYFDDINTILVLNDSKLHTLAHEFVHYFQIQYRHEDLKNAPVDFHEFEAVQIQHWFREKYLE